MSCVDQFVFGVMPYRKVLSKKVNFVPLALTRKTVWQKDREMVRYLVIENIIKS